MKIALSRDVRPPRIIGTDICYHIRSQCNNKEFRFEGDNDFQLYEEILFRYKEKYKFLLHNYTLMHTHVHLILTVVNEFTVDRIMRSISQIFSLTYNRQKGRTGHLWMNRYKCSVIDSDPYALCCMRYLDRNSVRADIVSEPSQWRWGGYNFYAHGKPNPLISPIQTYLALGNLDEERQKKYRDFVEQVFPSDEIRDKEWIQSRWPKSKHR